MVKSDFIDKHYYKFITGYGAYYTFYYFKYKEDYKIDNRLDFYYEIRFRNSEFKFYDSLKTSFHIDKYNIYEEVDFSEIVKYLPIGHPDRILFRKNRIDILLNDETIY